MTVQDKNAPDLVPLYKISDEMGMEFATASLHNSFYFVEAKNIIHDRPMVAKKSCWIIRSGMQIMKNFRRRRIGSVCGSIPVQEAWRGLKEMWI